MLKKNIYIYAIGTFCTKIIQFVLVPLLTFYFTTEEYGTSDLILATTSLILPFLTLAIYTSVFRFAAEKSNDPTKVFTVGFVVTLFGIIFSMPFVIYFENNYLDKFLYSIPFFIVSELIYNLVSFFAKVKSKSYVYVISNVLYGIISSSCALLFVAVFKFSVDGYFMSFALAYFISSIYIILSSKIWRYISLKTFDFFLMKSMLKYSIPLIINGVSWWLISASDKFITNMFLDINANGILAIVQKIPSVLTIVVSIFTSAFQISAVTEMDFTSCSLEEKIKISQKYEKIYNLFFCCLILVVSCITFVIEPFTRFLIEESYYVSYKYVPIYSLAVLFNCLAGYYGEIFSVAKDNKTILYVTLMGAVVNISLCYIFMGPLSMGLHGASISSLVSFLFVFIARKKMTQKYIVTKTTSKNLIGVALISAEVIINLLITDNILLFIINFIFIVIIFIFYFREILEVIKHLLPTKIKK